MGYVLALLSFDRVTQASVPLGHTRPLINLAARFVKLRPVYVTILTTNAFYDRVQAELARNFDLEDDEAAKRVRYVT